MMMADMGAEVIKIEDVDRPDGMRFYPPMVGGVAAGYLATNRGKRSLCLRLGSEEGRRTLLRLAQNADILVEGFRPGVLARLGLGYDAVSAVNPRLIVVSVTGYGQDGPYADRAGHDLNYLGHAGLLDTMGTAASGPISPGVQIADVAGGAYMSVIAALAALQSRNQTGKGQHVDVAMTDGVLPLLTLQLAHHATMDPPPTRGRHLLSGGVACYGIYACADGHHVVLAALEPKFWKRFCDLIDKPEWIARHLATGAENDRLAEDLRTFFLSRDRQYWIDLAADHDVCLTPLRTLDELEGDPHLAARGRIQRHRYGDGAVLMPGVPLAFGGTPVSSSQDPAPELGRDSVRILTEAGFSEEEIQTLIREGHVRAHRI